MAHDASKNILSKYMYIEFPATRMPNEAIWTSGWNTGFENVRKTCNLPQHWKFCCPQVCCGLSLVSHELLGIKFWTFLAYTICIYFMYILARNFQTMSWWDRNLFQNIELTLSDPSKNFWNLARKKFSEHHKTWQSEFCVKGKFINMLIGKSVVSNGVLVRQPLMLLIFCGLAIARNVRSG